jgi:hypothetical protein
MSVYENNRNASSKNTLTASFFETGAMQWQPQPKSGTQLFKVKGVWLVPNGHTLAGFAIGPLCWATMATLQSPFKSTTYTKLIFSNFSCRFLNPNNFFQF